jgi:hypothetical protein
MEESESRYRIRWRTLGSGRVARVGLAYAAAGWLLVQVVSTMLMPLGLPDWALRFIIVLVIAGFFVALAVAWGFDAGKGPHADVALPVQDADADRTVQSGLALHLFVELVGRCQRRTVQALCAGHVEEEVRGVVGHRGQDAVNNRGK